MADPTTLDLIKRLAASLPGDHPLAGDVWHYLRQFPPCQECGAMTRQEAETRCRCAGDKDDCHGCDLWPDADAALSQPVPQGPTPIDYRRWWEAHSTDCNAWCEQPTQPLILRTTVEALAWANHCLTRWGRPAVKPVPVAERLPGLEDCAPWPDDPTIPWCWYAREHEEGGWRWRQDSLCNPRAYGYTHWLPHWALPVPQQEATQ
jgi:hypothetical protein